MHDEERTVELINRIESRGYNYDVTADLMADLLMDPENSTYRMAEELMDVYIGGSSEFRKGFNAAVTTLLGWNMTTIVEQIANLAVESEFDSIDDEDDWY